MTGSNGGQQGGLLTTDQREYLESTDGDGSGARPTSTERVKRQRIRERLKNAMGDFTLLVEELEKRDRDLVFSEWEENEEFRDGVISAIEFLFLGLSSVGDEIGNGVGKTGYRNRPFNSALRLGIRDACSRLDMLVTEYEDPEYQTVSVEQREQTRERIKEGDPRYIGPKSVRLLLRSGDIKHEDLQEFLTEQVDE